MMHPFRKEWLRLHKQSIKENPRASSKSYKELSEKLEALAVEYFGPVDSHEDDGMGPPPKAVKVECMHCREVYSSAKMVRAYRPGWQGFMVSMLGKGEEKLEPMWWCRNIQCDGAGFKFDLRPVK